MNSERKSRRANQVNAIQIRKDFAARLQDGDYRELFGVHLESIFNQAMEHLAESGLAEEIGSLRIVLARLLDEEADLNRLAMNVARIVSVSIRSVQIHSAMTGQGTSEIIEAMSKILSELGGDILPGDTETPQ